MSDQACLEAGGVEFRALGTDCQDEECPVLPGACCFSDASCQETADADACEALGGIFQGHGSDCESGCPLPSGACCQPDGSCTDEPDEATCLGGGGRSFAGLGTDCETTGQECEPLPVGACCLDFEGGQLTEPCVVVEQELCELELGGQYQGDDTTCETDSDVDGVPDCDDCCPGTPPGEPVDAQGCALVGCDAGGPYAIVCTGGAVQIQLNGTATGQFCLPEGLQVELVAQWSTDCPNATISDPSILSPTLTIDAALADCPIDCSVTLTCEFVLVEDDQPRGVIGLPSDSDTDAVTVFLDCNGNQTDDREDIANGTSTDCNGNGIPDECEPAEFDCNGNLVPDECDLDPADPDGDGNVSPDCNANEVPDECETDCNGNGVPDDCDIDPGDPDGNGQVSADCNDNGIPDECDVNDGSADCNDNGVPDECETDCNGNGVPDDCDLGAGDPDGDGIVFEDDFSPDADGDGRPEQVPDGIPDECQVPRPEDCNPAVTGLSLLFSHLFRAPVCGLGCGMALVAATLGLAVFRWRHSRLRQRPRKAPHRPNLRRP